MLAAPLFVLLSSLAAAASQHVKVEPRVSGFIGQQALLRCQFVESDQPLTVTQVTWVKDPSGTKINLAVHNPELGTNYPTDTDNRIHFRNPSLEDATLVINNLQLSDDGIYSCEFATYPDGNQEAATNLTVLARPENTATALLVQAGESEVPVATCTSARGKPPAAIAWQGGIDGNTSTELKADPTGTTTVTSQFRAVPSGKIDGLQMQCIVTQEALPQPEVIPVMLSVQYPPIVTIEGYDDNWYLNREHASLTCNVKANPKADNFRWRMNGGDIPSNVQVNGHQLTVDIVTYKINGTFTCEATNSMGKSSGSVDIVVRDAPLQTGSMTGAIVGGIIAAIVILTVLVTAVLIFRRHRKNKESGEDDLEPPNHKPPPPKTYTGKVENADKLESIPLNATYFETNGEDGHEMSLTRRYSEPADEEDVKSPLDNVYTEQDNPIYDVLSYPEEQHRKSQEFVSPGMYV